MAKTLLEIIRERRSIRAYRDRPIEPEKIDRLVQALIWAPSSGNFQCRRFFFIRSRQLIGRVAESCFDHAWIAQAPLVVVCCRDDRIDEHYGPGSARFAVQDVSASIQNLLLAAHAEDLGSCWVCAFDEAGLEELLGLPPGLHPVALVTVGYADEDPPVPDRVGPDEAIAWLD
jgi:nitroreductase